MKFNRFIIIASLIICSAASLDYPVPINWCLDLRLSLLEKYEKLENLLDFSRKFELLSKKQEFDANSYFKMNKKEKSKILKPMIKSAICERVNKIQEIAKTLFFEKEEYPIDDSQYTGFSFYFQCLDSAIEKYKGKIKAENIILKELHGTFTLEPPSVNDESLYFVIDINYLKIFYIYNIEIYKFVYKIGRLLFCEILIELFEVLTYNEYFSTEITQLDINFAVKVSNIDKGQFEIIIRTTLYKIYQKHSKDILFRENLGTESKRIKNPAYCHRNLMKIFKENKDLYCDTISKELLDCNNYQIIEEFLKNVSDNYSFNLDKIKYLIENFEKYGRMNDNPNSKVLRRPNKEISFKFINNCKILTEKIHRYYQEIGLNMYVLYIFLEKMIMYHESENNCEIMNNYIRLQRRFLDIHSGYFNYFTRCESIYISE
ncbi:hypothetical protein H312_02788 [Anncaliia algerae PRA339]|uniref:Uncharacterized protein n=1 Tax=Anncaliia algerae PRA339 TaxID=1288291 RepID=A0A059EY21_9MICR|nr:hypothetical protein H312_02788 [Anncaliia algerae PRA339]